MMKPEIVRSWALERVGCPYIYGGSGNHAGRIGLYDDAGAQTLTTRNFKVELGSIATPWQMSAQDAYAEMLNTFAASVATVAETKTFLGIT